MNFPPFSLYAELSRQALFAAESTEEETHRLPNGLKLRFPPQMQGAASFLIREIFVRQRYRRPGFAIQPTDTVIDVGANMGLFALWAAPQAFAGRVIAIEPTDVIATLEHAVHINRLAHIETVRAAIGREGDELELVYYPGFNIVSHQSQWRPAILTRALVRLLYGRYDVRPVRMTATCRSLGAILDAYEVDKVDFLKIDCEGAEYDLLNDLTPRDWRRIERIALEFHELHPDHRHENLVELLRDRGFQVEVHKPWFDYYCLKYGEIWAWRE